MGSRLPTGLPSIEQLLCSLGLAHCQPALTHNGVRTLDQLCRLNTIDYLSYGLGQDEATRIQLELQRLLAQQRAYATLPYRGNNIGDPAPPVLPRNPPPPVVGYQMVATLNSQRRQPPTAEGFFV